MQSNNMANVLEEVACQHLTLLHYPSAVKVKGKAGNVAVSKFSDSLSLVLGITPRSPVDWHGLQGRYLHKTPHAVAVVAVRGGLENSDAVTGPKFLLDNDDELIRLQQLGDTVLSSYAGKSPMAITMELDDLGEGVTLPSGGIFSNLPQSLVMMDRNQFPQTSALNSSHLSDALLLGELWLVEHILDTVSEQKQRLSQKSSPDVYLFVVNGLQSIRNKYRRGSEHRSEAENLLVNSVEKVTRDLRKLYDDDVLVTMVTLSPVDESSAFRTSRHLLETKKKKKEPTLESMLNLAAEYNADFPVFFNIALWLSILFFVAVYGIGYGLWFMDPGRDSIIYRMTAQRSLKKDQ